jgi:pyruvate dehydrogenase E1 component alpha subunit
MSVMNEVEQDHVVAREAPGIAERDRLRLMLLIRRFEETTFREYTNPRSVAERFCQRCGKPAAEGRPATEMKISGFCHLYSGQEAVAAGLAAVYRKGLDYLITAYRCHGHSLALGMDPRAGFAELFGKATGCSKGKGGSMHFFDAANGNMGGHGIVGGHLPLGLGLAFAQAYQKTGGVTFCLFGDGAVNQGTHNETLNMASLMKVPCLFIVENNHLAMGTQVERHSAETDLQRRAAGYNMPFESVDGNDVDAVIAALGPAAERARRGEGPTYIVANTYRFRGHSMSDAMKYRTEQEKEKARLGDPIRIYEQRLRSRGLLTDRQLQEMHDDVAAVIDAALRQAEADPYPLLEDRFEDCLAETYPLDQK